MEYFPPALERLVEQFARLPGVGRKSAQRLAFFVLGLPEQEAEAFAGAITEAKRAIHFCPVCQNFAQGDGPCPICRSGKRDGSVICVVADEEEREAQVIVPDYQLSLAIGKEGQNARLAARLTGFKIDIKSETQAKEMGLFEQMGLQ